MLAEDRACRRLTVADEVGSSAFVPHEPNATLKESASVPRRGMNGNARDADEEEDLEAAQ